MNQLLAIQDDKIVIKTLVLESTSGAVSHTGSFAITESVTVGKDLTVSGTVTAGTIKVKNLITESGTIEGVGQWTVSDENDLNGKGFSWQHGLGAVQFMYRNGGRLWSSGDVDLEKSKSYKIDNTPVISLTELGPQVKKSSLTELGSLKSLRVSGNANIGDFAVFNSVSGRMGLNTEDPNGALSIVDNNVEIIITSPDVNQAAIGTYSNHDLAIVTDNTPRVFVKNNGEVHIGNEQTKTGVLRVFGTLYADNLIADTRMERSSSLEFKATRTDTIYGKGLLWSGDGSVKQLILTLDKIRSSESFELAADKEFFIGGSAVLSQQGLGLNVINSNLTSVGTLKSLTVSGTATFLSKIDSKLVEAETVLTEKINVVNDFTISIRSHQALYADNNQIEIGDKLNTRRPVKVFGPLSVGISNPDPSVDLSVKGNISFADKKFITGPTAPTSGTFNKGDICWSTTPTEFNYVGWVCSSAGSPGTWLPFGAIARQ